MTTLAIIAALSAALFPLWRGFEPYQTLYETWPHGDPRTWPKQGDDQ